MHEYRLCDPELGSAGISQVWMWCSMFYLFFYWIFIKSYETYKDLCCFARKKDAFVLCRIFQKSGLGPPNGDRYAPFVEEEWDEDAPLLMPGEDAEDDLATGEEPRLVHYTDIEQVYII